ncbi:hypothetical protein V4C53_44735 [Paraburkholderia azotifigens]|uniref:hypothetical protein n=1 Tax=Paraburkholderia azotifigens TaxID=2057004 RepID=UPI00316B2C20
MTLAIVAKAVRHIDRRERVSYKIVKSVLDNGAWVYVHRITRRVLTAAVSADALGVRENPPVSG